MAVSFMQKIRLALRGWSRRREQDEARKQEEFLRRNMAWGAPPVPPPATAAPKPAAAPLKAADLEGLQAAYLDASGQIAYYLDVQTGDVVDVRDGASMDAARYKRVPTAVERSEMDERRAFIETLEPSSTRDLLMKSVATVNFRSALASDRATERAWYNFRNSRATAAIETWLKKLGGG